MSEVLLRDKFGRAIVTIGDDQKTLTFVGGAQMQLPAPSVPVVAFANLPAAPVEGMLFGVTDSNTAVWGATVAAGGANHVLAYFDGTNWTVAGK